MTAPRVFISHSHHDVEYCRSFVAILLAYGANVVYDETALSSGSLRNALEQQIASCPHFIVVFSPAAVASQWVAAEIDAALELERGGTLQTFLPVIAAPCEIPLMIRRYRCIGNPDGSPLSLPDSALAAWNILQQTPVRLPAPAALQAGTTLPTPPIPVNQGIIVNGGSISSNNIIVGNHGRIDQSGLRNPDELKP